MQRRRGASADILLDPTGCSVDYPQAPQSGAWRPLSRSAPPYTPNLFIFLSVEIWHTVYWDGYDTFRIPQRLENRPSIEGSL